MGILDFRFCLGTHGLIVLPFVCYGNTTDEELLLLGLGDNRGAITVAAEISHGFCDTGINKGLVRGVYDVFVVPRINGPLGNQFGH